MSYAIIGSGNIGSALASHFARNGIDVLVASKSGPASVGAALRDLGPQARAATVVDALQADLVILAVPFGAVPDLPASGRPWSGRIVVDATNAIDFPAFTPTDLGGRLSTEVVSDTLPGARVVKAFNTLPAALLAAEPSDHGGRRVVFLSGNDADANASVAALIERLGFAAVDLGKLADGRAQQFGGALVAVDFIKHSPPRGSR